MFAGLFLLLAGIGWLSARLVRRVGVPAAAPGATATGPDATASGPGTTTAKPTRTPAARPARTPAARATRPTATGPPEATGGSTAASVSAVLARVVPYFTVAVAAFVPLAAGLYLLTTTAWTLAERAFVQRTLAARPGVDRREGIG